MALDSLALTTPPPTISLANLLTEAHGLPATGACPRLTNQALAGVADMQMVTGLPQPPGTHSTAATAIHHQGHPRWALGWCPGTSTGRWAQLGTHLRRQRPYLALTITAGMETFTTGHFVAKSDSVGPIAWPWGYTEPALNQGRLRVLLRGSMTLCSEQGPQARVSVLGAPMLVELPESSLSSPSLAFLVCKRKWG